MTCHSCNQPIDSNSSGFVVCPNCASVNIANSTESPTTSESSPTFPSTAKVQGQVGEPITELPGRKHHLKQLLLANKLATTAVIGLIIICSVFGVVSALNAGGSNNKNPSPSTATPQPKSQTKSSPESKKEAADKPSAQTPSAATNSPAPQTPLEQLVASMNQKLKKYGVSVTLSPSKEVVQSLSWSVLSSADIASLQQFSDYLTQEFSKYPTDLVTNSGLKTVGLVKKLVVDNQERAAAPSPYTTAMIYDVNAMVNAGSEYAREVISHEYWHYLDFAMQGTFYYLDSAWTACNPKGFSYGAGGASTYEPGSGYSAAFHPSTAFITAYSKYGIEEDRAEMFGWLMYSPTKVKSLNDTGINCKIKRLTTIVHQLSPSMAF